MLTDFSIFEDFVYEKKLISGQWTKVWTPIIPTDGDFSENGKPAIRAFLYSEDCKNEGKSASVLADPKSMF